MPSPARPVPTSQPTPQARATMSPNPGLLFLFERLTLDSHIREATQEPNHDGSGAVSGSLTDGRETCNFDVRCAVPRCAETRKRIWLVKRLLP